MNKISIRKATIKDLDVIIAILHVGSAKADKNQPKFNRFADLNVANNGKFSTGALEHFCLALDWVVWNNHQKC